MKEKRIIDNKSYDKLENNKSIEAYEFCSLALLKIW